MIKYELEFKFGNNTELSKDFFTRFTDVFVNTPVGDDDALFLNDFAKIAKIEGNSIKAFYEADSYYKAAEEWGFEKIDSIASSFSDIKIGVKVKITYPGDYDSTQNDYYTGICLNGKYKELWRERYNLSLDYESASEREDYFSFFKFPSLD